MYTVWGKSDYQRKLAEGIYIVGTPSHGGIVFTTREAIRRLSPEAVKRGESTRSALCFEEDCAYAIPAFELEDVRLALKGDTVTLESLLDTISMYDADYLLERGLTPTMPAYQRYLDWQADERMRRERHPDLIVCATGLNNGTVEVITADGLKHVVTKESYPPKVGMRLLSNCVIA